MQCGLNFSNRAINLMNIIFVNNIIWCVRYDIARNTYDMKHYIIIVENIIICLLVCDQHEHNKWEKFDENKINNKIVGINWLRNNVQTIVHENIGQGFLRALNTNNWSPERENIHIFVRHRTYYINIIIKCCVTH